MNLKIMTTFFESSGCIENKYDRPFLLLEKEYVIGMATIYIYLANTV